MNTNIENIRLKNGEEYPVSPAYFDGITVPIDLMLEDPNLDIITMTLGGSEALPAVKVSQTLPSPEIFAKIQPLDLHITGGDTPYDMVFHVTPANVFDFDTAIKMMYPEASVIDFSDIPIKIAVMSMTGTYAFANMLYAPEKKTYSYPDYQVEIDVPSPGLYAVVQNADMFGNVHITGEGSFGEWHFPENYYKSIPYEEISAPWTQSLDPTILDELEEHSLYGFDQQKEALQRALTNAKPLYVLSGTSSIILDTYIFQGFAGCAWTGSPIIPISGAVDGLYIPILYVDFERHITKSVSGTITYSSVTVNAVEYEAKTKGNLNEQIFTFDGTNWYLDSDVVTLADYGITLDAEPTTDDTISVKLRGNSVSLGWTKVMDIPSNTPPQEEAST